MGGLWGQLGGAEAARRQRVDDHSHHDGVPDDDEEDVHDDDWSDVEGRPREVRQLWQHRPPPLRSKGFSLSAETQY